MYRNFIHKYNFSPVLFIGIVTTLLTASCKKLIEVPAPNSSVTEASVFASDQTAIAAITGLYSQVSQGSNSILNLSKLAGLSADEFDLWSGSSDMEKAYYENNLQTHFNNAGIEAGGELWNSIYPAIYSTNQALDNLERANTLTPKVKQQLTGECKFYRAFMYFYLVNLYGDVPLALSSSPESNQRLPRSPAVKVYEQIVSDLTIAKDLLNPDYVNSALLPYGSGGAERTRPNRSAATALLARVWLYTAQYPKAIEAATEVINQTSIYDLPGVPLSEVFKKNSPEAIWQLQPVSNNLNTRESQMFFLNADPIGFSDTKTTFLSQSLLQDFESGDDRRTVWVNAYSSSNPSTDFFFPSKYVDANFNADINPSTGTTNMTEYSMVLRLAEQYLIRAEAKAQVGDLTGAIADINVIRTRARGQATAQVPNPLPNLAGALNQQQVLNAVSHEKKIELFSEWGHRWLDLKRTGQVNTVMQVITPLKGGSWQPFQSLYPIPARELHYAPQLTQNPGYQ